MGSQESSFGQSRKCSLREAVDPAWEPISWMRVTQGARVFSPYEVIDLADGSAQDAGCPGSSFLTSVLVLAVPDCFHHFP